MIPIIGGLQRGFATASTKFDPATFHERPSYPECLEVESVTLVLDRKSCFAEGGMTRVGELLRNSVRKNLTQGAPLGPGSVRFFDRIKAWRVKPVIYGHSNLVDVVRSLSAATT